MEAVPVKIKLRSPGGIRIHWSDGHESLYPYGYLRRRCPCATCEDSEPTPLEEGPGTLPILGQEAIRPVSASPVGRYAIQFSWNDGHNSGLYSFDYLRSICPCPECTAADRAEESG